MNMKLSGGLQVFRGVLQRFVWFRGVRDFQKTFLIAGSFN